jgi:ketosteroid isomerase-like protein
MTNRLTWALRKTGGAWKVVHEHSSAPIDFESAKAMLQR